MSHSFNPRKNLLPMDDFLEEIGEKLRAYSSIIVTAEPGAGKTTRLPPALLAHTNKAVWVLEPRRIAAVSASHRIALEQGWKLGQEVGYQVRFDNRSSVHTRLLFLTEALLLRKLTKDPELSDVGIVVLDEFHERSVHVDLALAALKELQDLARPDLKIVVMSATLDALPLSAYLGDAPIITVPGKVFPLEVRNESRTQLLQSGFELTNRMHALVQKAAQEQQGDVLCFLPGRGEIERLRESLREWAHARNYALLPLHGQLSLEEQRRATAPSEQRKILLSTNVAESSLTVEGVRIVVDSGLARIVEMHPRTGFESMELVRISKASAKQRAGRAARNAPGVVYRAWSPHDELSMKEFEVAELHRSDLSEPLLLLSALGVTKPENFSWFEFPQERSLQQAQQFLLAIGALQEDGSLSELGKQLREVPLHPRIAMLLLEGKKCHAFGLACELAALLAEPARGSQEGSSSFSGVAWENDLWLRWQRWKRNPSGQVSRAVEQLRSIFPAEALGESNEEKAVELVFRAYRDRLCRRRKVGEPKAKMAGGRGVRLHADSSVSQSEFFVALEVKEGRDASEALVFQAVGIPVELVEKELRAAALPIARLDWDEEKERFWVSEGMEWNSLLVSSAHRRTATAAEVEEYLPAVAEEKWERILARNEDLSHWWARLRFLQTRGKILPLTMEQVRAALDMACYGESSLAALYVKKLVPFLESQLSEEGRKALDSCPDHWLAPSGQRHKIIYSEEQGPQVEVRLQELFGLPQTPLVMGIPLTLVLLGPNFRPVQVTRDLESFWRNGYPEVRKELRSRYPKHSWPEDPLSAEPQAKGRRRN